MILYTIFEKFKKLKILTHLRLDINQNLKFFSQTSSQKYLDPGSGSEILDFHLRIRIQNTGKKQNSC